MSRFQCFCSEIKVLACMQAGMVPHLLGVIIQAAGLWFGAIVDVPGFCFALMSAYIWPHPVCPSPLHCHFSFRRHVFKCFLRPLSSLVNAIMVLLVYVRSLGRCLSVLTAMSFPTPRVQLLSPVFPRCCSLQGFPWPPCDRVQRLHLISYHHLNFQKSLPFWNVSASMTLISLDFLLSLQLLYIQASLDLTPAMSVSSQRSFRMAGELWLLLDAV